MWLRQVVQQSLIVAIAAAGLIWLPWLATKVLFGAFLLWFVVSIGRNPLTFWRRLARMVVVVAIPPLIAGISFKAHGKGLLPANLGTFDISIEQSSGDTLWLILVVLLCTMAFDALLFWHEARLRSEAFSPEGRDVADLAVEDQSVLMRYELLIGANEKSLDITGGRLVVFAPFPCIIDCELFAHWPELAGANRPIEHHQPLHVAAHARESLYVTADLGRGLAARWLRWFTSPALGWTGFALGEIQLTGLPRLVSAPLPLRFRRAN